MRLRFFCALFFFVCSGHFYGMPMYFAMVADTEHFKLAAGLIKSIQRTNAQSLQEIAVFDIGLQEHERDYLQRKPKVRVIPIEMTHPELTKKFVVRPDGRLVRGWYAWKAVALKQALDLYPYVFYIDAGMRVINDMTPLFQALEQEGYFLIEAGHTIRPMTTQRVKDFFHLTENDVLLEEPGLAAGFQGISRALYQTYVLPMYKLTFDLSLFEDDGTAPWGFGGARHDQTLFSIMAQKLNLLVRTGSQPNFVSVNGKKVRFNVSHYLMFKK